MTVLPSLKVLQESPEFQHTLDKRYKRLHVKLEDADHANLLLHVPSASAFIQSALYGGGQVLVHCAAGISRSATVVMAYLMKTEQLTPEEALEAVRQHAPWVDPNPGFKHQLALFAAMGHKLDPEYAPYRAMLLAQQRQLATLNTRPLPKQSKSGDWVCKQCHRLLVTADRVINSRHGHVDGALHQAQQCILVKPQRWMGGSMSSASGGPGSSILCPNCGTAVVATALSVNQAEAEGETKTLFGKASPPTSYGGYGGNAKEGAKYTFEYPASWKNDVVNKTEKGMQGIDSRVINPKIGKTQGAFVVTFGRAGEDKKFNKLGDVEATLQGFAGADYDLQDALVGATDKKNSQHEKDGELFYDYEVTGADLHYLASITLKSGKVFALFVKSPTKNYAVDRDKLKAIVDSFTIL
ncbi:hypothetical protein WJX79_000323 [Trebouxia sp. C0005]